jgi:hypothetical protein
MAGPRRGVPAGAGAVAAMLNSHGMKPVALPPGRAIRPMVQPKWLELLKQIAPGVTRVAVLRDASQAFATSLFAVMQAVAPSLGVEVIPVNMRKYELVINVVEPSTTGPAAAEPVDGSTRGSAGLPRTAAMCPISGREPMRVDRMRVDRLLDRRQHWRATSSCAALLSPVARVRLARLNTRSRGREASVCAKS